MTITQPEKIKITVLLCAVIAYARTLATCEMISDEKLKSKMFSACFFHHIRQQQKFRRIVTNTANIVHRELVVVFFPNSPLRSLTFRCVDR